MNLTRILPVAIGALSVLEGGCRHAAKAAAFEFVDPSRLRMPDTGEVEPRIEKGRTVFVDATPVEPLARPVCPDVEPSSSLRPVTLRVRILVGEEGRVHALEKSSADFSIPSRFSSRCFDAIGGAVDQWKFEPAQLMVLEPQEDGCPLVVSSSLVGTSFEVVFTFSSAGKVDSTMARN